MVAHRKEKSQKKRGRSIDRAKQKLLLDCPRLRHGMDY
jgi:hypothetical protein